ncbi:thiol-disulfide oxidoreductase [uncultured Clostridium sp.]|nr:thiol-disulfide oxidoreductase [uncultured Clostridium sp.]SCI99419.1 thiol-disulfide oxidoreductase [uncultured Clostridium sp.]
MNKSKLKKGATLLLLLLSAIIVFLIVGCTNLGHNSQNIISSSNIFKEMQTTDINGNTVDSSIFSEKKLTLTNVWNTGCTPCIDEIPILDKLNKEYEKKGVSIKGLLLESGVGLTEQEKSVVEEILSKSKSSYQ